MTDSTRPQRDYIVGAVQGWLDKNVYAEAGAGTGKTSALVERIVNLLLSDEITPDNIVAVTFTVAAASELRQRVREALEERRLEVNAECDTNLASRIVDSIESLDSAFIGTIHGFAQSLLTERPIEAGLPPVFEVNDQIQSEQNFDRAWSEWLDFVLQSEDFRTAVINLQMLGLHDPLKKLYDLALEFRNNYDLIESAVPLKSGKSVINLVDHLKSIQSDLNQSMAYAEYCKKPEVDLMHRELKETIAPLAHIVSDALESKSSPEHILAIAQIPKFRYGRTGLGDNWRLNPAGDKVLPDIRKLLTGARATAEAAREIVAQPALVVIANKIAEMVLEFIDSQRESGLVSFQDLLVLACRMLEENPEARSDFQRRYTRILIDEFQDTDPLQLKLAILLSSTAQGDAPDPGRLFVVGDPKQSIYRFRRADLTQLSGLVDSMKSNRKSLNHNFRSHKDILHWVNQIFEPWFNTWPQDSSYMVQAAYESLAAGSDEYVDVEQPRVIVTGDNSYSNLAQAREAEAKKIAKLAVSVGSGAWNVTQRNRPSRNSTYRDLAVLFPSRRTVLPYIEREFVALGVPYILEGRTAVFEEQVIRDLTNCLAAIDDPTDQVAIVASLKSVVWGCSDQDLYDWAKTGRKFDYASGIAELDNEDSDGARCIHKALTNFSEYHTKRHFHTTADLLELLVRDRRLREVSTLTNSGDNEIRLIDLFIEMARDMQDVGTGSIREFIRSVESQMESRETVEEGALANSEINAVRIMTVHASKGLEFPIVAVTGLQSNASTSNNSSLIEEFDGAPELSISLGADDLKIHTSNYYPMQQRDREAAEAEFGRLAYVATTRARDHLLVSVHRSSRKAYVADKIALENSKLQLPAAEFDEIDMAKSSVVTPVVVTRNNEIFDWTTESEWIERTSVSVNRALRRGYTTPSQLTDHNWDSSPKPDDSSESLELDSAQRGRAATQVGSAVHQVLQDLNFDDTSEIGVLVRSAIEAYELDVEPAIIEHKIRNVLQAPSLREVSEANCIHEAWIAAEIDTGVELEGAVDLLIRHEDDSFTIVDFKTDRVSGEDLDKRAEIYAPQLGGYALILEALDMNVADAILIFSDGGEDGGYREFKIADLDSAKRQAITQAKTSLGI